MSHPADNVPLPAGMTDLLPPHAAFEAVTVERLMSQFASYGYERVKPPLLEFEDSLVAGSGATLAPQTFRLMDPVSQRMLALRPDITMQVARIATGRLANRPRPLRLGYAGQVVRVKGSQLRFERQFGQVGAEIVGCEHPAADAEVIQMSASSLAGLGIVGLTVDLSLPALVPAILHERNLDARLRARIRTVLNRKDRTAVLDLAPAIGNETARLLSDLIVATGPAENTIDQLARAKLAPRATAQRAALLTVYQALRAADPELTLSIDPVENRGFEYHTGVTFTLFARNVRGELGRGGRYLTSGGNGNGEPATGVTLFMDSVVRALQVPRATARLFLPADTEPDDAQRLREHGWIAVSALGPAPDPTAEAARLRCSHVFLDGAIHEVKPEPR